MGSSSAHIGMGEGNIFRSSSFYVGQSQLLNSSKGGGGKNLGVVGEVAEGWACCKHEVFFKRTE